MIDVGLYLERVAIVGPDVPPSELAFSDGLNVVSGASETGKSYLCSLIDFIFGSSDEPNAIPTASGYQRVQARVRHRPTGDGYDLERFLVGGALQVVRNDRSGRLVERWTAKAKHRAGDDKSLSALLLSLSGLASVNVRTNAKGSSRTLSFRDIAYLIVVDEARMISKDPPHLSPNYIERTVEGEVFRYLLTGAAAATPPVVPARAPVQGAKAQLELVNQLIGGVQRELAQLRSAPRPPEEELAHLDAARTELLGSYEVSRVELMALEDQLRGLNHEFRDIGGRLAVVQGLIARFELLNRHYASDIERLSAIQDAGSMLEALPAVSCPVCGAPPESHRPDEAKEHFNVTEVRQAATAERGKLHLLRSDLEDVLGGLGREQGDLQREEERIRTEVLKWTPFSRPPRSLRFEAAPV